MNGDYLDAAERAVRDARRPLDDVLNTPPPGGPTMHSELIGTGQRLRRERCERWYSPPHPATVTRSRHRWWAPWLEYMETTCQNCGHTWTRTPTEYYEENS